MRALINKTIEPFNATVFDILWARERCGQDIAVHLERLAQVILPVVVRFTRTQFTQSEQFLSVYAQHLSIVLAACDSLEQHPWAWITQPLGFEQEERVLDALNEFLATVKTADEVCEYLREIAGITMARSVHGLEQAATMLAILPNPEAMLIGDLLARCDNATTRQLLAGVCRTC